MSDNKKILSAGAVIIFILIGVLLNAKNQSNNYSQILEKQQNQGASTGNYNFAPQQSPTFNFPSVAYASNLQKNTSIYNPRGEKIQAEINVSASGNGASIQVKKPQQFLPGKYSLIIDQNGKKIEQDFTWGVLAINTNKSIYTPGETALLSLAVLDEKGKMVCDAKVTLKITDPSGNTTTATTDNGSITVNKECYIKAMTTKPDYETAYKVDAAGTYQMDLSAQTKNGTFEIQDSFEVSNSVDFDVARTTATRIFPFSTYPMLINITANKDFSGQIQEPVPTSFKITTLENTTAYNSIQANGNTQSLIWNVSLKKGQSINIGYNYKAPEISPQFYLLGPLSFVSGNTTVFQEKRQWQLAIDGLYSSDILGTSGLISYWRLGEPSGTSASDSKGSNTGTYIASPTLGQSGGIIGDSDTAVKFVHASSQYVTVADNATLHFTSGPMSIELWYKSASIYSQINSTAFGQNRTGAPLVELNGLASGAWRFYSSVNGVGATSGNFITPDNTLWHQMVGTVDVSNNYKVYVDGVDRTTFVGNPAFGYAGTTSTGIANDGGGYEPFDGTLDDVSLYSVVLTPAQILDHYNTGEGISGTCYATPHKVQTANNKATSTSVTITLGSTPTPGNDIVLSTFDNANVLTSVSETGVSWVPVQFSYDHVPNEIWVGTNIQAGASTTITLTGPSGNMGGIATEWSGLRSPNPINWSKGQGDNVSDTTFNTGSITPSQNGELIVATITSNNVAITGGPSNGYTSDTGSPLVQSITDFASGYLIQTSAASTSTAWTGASSNTTDGVIVSFYPATVQCGGGDFKFQGLRLNGIRLK